MRRMIDVGPRAAAANLRGACGRIDANPFICDRSMTMPSSQVPRPPPLCCRREPRSAACSTGIVTVAMTSATSTHRTMSAGCLSIIPL
jgi:hypothetical protein